MNHWISHHCFHITLLILMILSCGSSYKVAILPMMGTSHSICMDIITQQLIKRGHETITVASNEPHHLKKLKPSPLALYEIDTPITEEDTKDMVRSKNPLYPISQFFKFQKLYCNATLSNKTLLQSLQDVDIFVNDGVYICGILLPEVLHKPFINVAFNGDIFGVHTFFGQYRPASYVAYHPLLHAPKLSFLQRLANMFLKFGVDYSVTRLSNNYANELRLKHNISTHLSIDDIGRKMSMFIATLDFSIEISRPLPPYVHLVGPLLAHAPSPLPQVYEDFIQSSKHGTILMAFGTEVQIDDKLLPETLKAFSTLPYHIIWRTKQKVENLPNHIKIFTWIPQNDILGHKKVIGFITHCGANSLYEGAYHGVPMLCMPTTMEQRLNAINMINAGIGLVMENFFSFNAEEIVENVKKLLSDTSYRENAQNISNVITASGRSTRDKIVDLIEYTMKTGGAHHLKVKGETLSFYEHYNLDVFAFVTVVIYVIYRLLRYSVSSICASKSKTKSD